MATTITLDEATKRRLAELKGSATWDEYLAKVADIYPPDDVLEELAERMRQLGSGDVRALDWGAVRDRFA